MKQTTLALMGLLVSVIFLSSCEKVEGEGPVRTEVRNVGSFSGIDLRISGTVNYTQDSTYKVEVMAQQNILDVLETYISANKLVIRYKNDIRVKRHEDIVINISAPAQNSIRLSGSGNLRAATPMMTLGMLLEVSGSGNIFLNQLNTGDLEANISGSGNITVDNGTARDERLRISGSGNIDLLDVAATRATTNTSGSGETRLHVTNSLDATISGSGSVYYRGTPVISTRISGSGRVRPY